MATTWVYSVWVRTGANRFPDPRRIILERKREKNVFIHG
jgi:hypothetical protein